MSGWLRADARTQGSRGRVCWCVVFACVGLHTATHCHTLPHTAAAHCRTLPPHTAAHCRTLPHTAAHCRTLPHTAALLHCHTATRRHCRTATRRHCRTAALLHCRTADSGERAEAASASRLPGTVAPPHFVVRCSGANPNVPRYWGTRAGTETEVQGQF
jgi:hypothetical protein